MDSGWALEMAVVMAKELGLEPAAVVAPELELEPAVGLVMVEEDRKHS